MNEKYKQLEGSGAPPPYESQQQFGTSDNYVNATIEYNGYTLATPKERLLKPWKIMRYLTVVELILAIICIVLGSACLGTSASIISSRSPDNGYCMEASGIWVGIFCVVTGSLGIGALGVPTGRKCLLVSYFVMSILSTIGCGILLIFSSIWAGISKSTIDHYYYQTNYGPLLAIFIFNIILVATSLTHLIMSIVSCAFICYNWNCCCGGSSSPTVTIVHGGNVQRPEVAGQSTSYHNV